MFELDPDGGEVIEVSSRWHQMSILESAHQSLLIQTQGQVSREEGYGGITSNPPFTSCPGLSREGPRQANRNITLVEGQHEDLPPDMD